MSKTVIAECGRCDHAHILTRSESLKLWLCEIGFEELKNVDYGWDIIWKDHGFTEENGSVFNIPLKDWEFVMRQFREWKKGPKSEE